MAAKFMEVSASAITGRVAGEISAVGEADEQTLDRLKREQEAEDANDFDANTIPEGYVKKAVQSDEKNACSLKPE
jgi:hypothetical protein